jgi:predicted metalloprotease with PDZ domain
MKYFVKYNNPERHFIDFKLVVNTKNIHILKLQLPSWRPGRYELGNFAKNIKDFKVFTNDNQLVRFSKKNKDLWEIDCNNFQRISIHYQYYAADLNAGSTYLDQNQLYINPVNCMLYNIDNYELGYEVEFDIPSDYQIFSSLKQCSKKILTASNFEELADSPIIISNNSQSESITINDIIFTFCFQGEIKVDWDRIFKDFKRFILYQIQLFGSFPHEKFIFLFQITPYSSYHGVEHHKSTVILLGPSYSIFDSFYSELLGISSHELYHVWNVKNIRPKAMLPYNFSKENYTDMGYVTEGVTTYMGDRILFESGVFSTDQYFKELQKIFQRHFHNDGRKYYSVAESSFDTWLDGYVSGSPGRKVSIYVEGALIALICDAQIRKATNHNKSLHQVMKSMYSGTDKLTGYDSLSYKKLLESVSGISFDKIFKNLVYGKEDFYPYLMDSLAVFGWSFNEVKHEKCSWNFGFKSNLINNKLKINSVLENSAAFNSHLVEDDYILAVNNYSLENNLDKWLNYFNNDDIILKISRKGKIMDLKLNKENDIQYFNYKFLKK